jgi:hypothetical protein
MPEADMVVWAKINLTIYHNKISRRHHDVAVEVEEYVRFSADCVSRFYSQTKLFLQYPDNEYIRSDQFYSV